MPPTRPRQVPPTALPAPHLLILGLAAAVGQKGIICLWYLFFTCILKRQESAWRQQGLWYSFLPDHGDEHFEFHLVESARAVRV